NSKIKKNPLVSNGASQDILLLRCQGCNSRIQMLRLQSMNQDAELLSRCRAAIHRSRT
ncbi:hypothetical protein FRX31_004452, partial [Thalictrum thalictroides]